MIRFINILTVVIFVIALFAYAILRVFPDFLNSVAK